jgi:DNA-binding response OmpR family regulator
MIVDSIFTSPHLGHSAMMAMSFQGMKVVMHSNPNSVLERADPYSTDALIIEDDGVNLTNWLSMLSTQLNELTPLLVFGPGDSRSISRALSAGATDYATLSEGALGLCSRLSARIDLLNSLRMRATINVGDYVIDRLNRVLRHGKQQVNLTDRELGILVLLATYPGQVVDTKHICANVCRRTIELGKRAVEQNIYRLRKKVSSISPLEYQKSGSLMTISAVYSFGYRLDVI